MIDDRLTLPKLRRCVMGERKDEILDQAKPGDEAPPGTPGTGEALCPDCAGTGRRDERVCPTCRGTGKVTAGISGG
jgi:hypothetical protein